MTFLYFFKYFYQMENNWTPIYASEICCDLSLWLKYKRKCRPRVDMQPEKLGHYGLLNGVKDKQGSSKHTLGISVFSNTKLYSARLLKNMTTLKSHFNYSEVTMWIIWPKDYESYSRKHQLFQKDFSSSMAVCLRRGIWDHNTVMLYYVLPLRYSGFHKSLHYVLQNSCPLQPFGNLFSY